MTNEFQHAKYYINNNNTKPGNKTDSKLTNVNIDLPQSPCIITWKRSIVGWLAIWFADPIRIQPPVAPAISGISDLDSPTRIVLI
jgi:hypothetical protein